MAHYCIGTGATLGGQGKNWLFSFEAFAFFFRKDGYVVANKIVEKDKSPKQKLSLEAKKKFSKTFKKMCKIL